MINLQKIDLENVSDVALFLNKVKNITKVPKRKTKLFTLFVESLLKKEMIVVLDKLELTYDKNSNKSVLEKMLISNLTMKCCQTVSTPERANKRVLRNLVSPDNKKKHFAFDKDFTPDWDEVLNRDKDIRAPSFDYTDSTKAPHQDFMGIKPVENQMEKSSSTDVPKIKSVNSYTEIDNTFHSLVTDLENQTEHLNNGVFNTSKVDDFEAAMSSYMLNAEATASTLRKQENEKKQAPRTSGKLQLVIGRTEFATVEKNVQKFVIVVDLKEIKRNIVFWCYNGDYMKEVFDIFGRFKNKPEYKDEVLSLYRCDMQNDDEIMVTQTNYKLKGVCICVNCKGSVQVAERKYKQMSNEIVDMMTSANFFTMYKAAIDGYNKKLTGTSVTQNKFQEILVKNYDNKTDYYWLTEKKYCVVEDVTPVKLTEYFRTCDIKRFIHEKLSA